MEKEFKTLTYGTHAPLKIAVSKNIFNTNGVEVKAKVDLDTGEVKFFVDKAELRRLREADED